MDSFSYNSYKIINRLYWKWFLSFPQRPVFLYTCVLSTYYALSTVTWSHHRETQFHGADRQVSWWWWPIVRMAMAIPGWDTVRMQRRVASFRPRRSEAAWWRRTGGNWGQWREGRGCGFRGKELRKGRRGGRAGLTYNVVPDNFSAGPLAVLAHSVSVPFFCKWCHRSAGAGVTWASRPDHSTYSDLLNPVGAEHVDTNWFYETQPKTFTGVSFPWTAQEECEITCGRSSPSGLGGGTCLRVTSNDKAEQGLEGGRHLRALSEPRAQLQFQSIPGVLRAGEFVHFFIIFCLSYVPSRALMNMPILRWPLGLRESAQGPGNKHFVGPTRSNKGGHKWKSKGFGVRQVWNLALALQEVCDVWHISLILWACLWVLSFIPHGAPIRQKTNVYWRHLHGI